MMKITGLSHLFKWENLHNWWLTKYFFAPLYVCVYIYIHIFLSIFVLFTSIKYKNIYTILDYTLHLLV